MPNTPSLTDPPFDSEVSGVPGVFLLPIVPVTAIAAVARNGVIGNHGEIPWHIPEDFRRFKKVTMGGALIMGRTTFESIGKPLPGRITIVVSRSTAPAGRHVAQDDASVGPDGVGFAPTLRHSACESQNLVGQTRPGYCDFAQDDGGPPPNPTTPDQVQWASSVPAALDLAATLALPVFVAGGAQIYRAAWPYLTHLDITEVDLEPDGDALFPPIDSRWAESSREPHDGYAFVQYERAASERRPEENGSMCHSATSSCAQVAEQRTHSIGSDPATPLRSAPDDEDDPNDNRPLSQSLATTDDA